jgi:hypothetical protein
MDVVSNEVSNKPEVKSFGLEDKKMINETLLSLYEKLTEFNKYPLKSHLASVYLDRNGNHIEFDENFYIGGTDEETCDLSGWLYAWKDKKNDPNRMVLTIKNPDFIKDGEERFSFAFPKKMMGKPYYRREKLCAWMVKETFKTFDADELERFVDNESVFEKQIRWIDWDSHFDNHPDWDKIGGGYVHTPKEEVA